MRRTDSTTATGNRRRDSGAKVLLKDRAYAQLKDLIQSGFFAPNDFLSERQLVQRLGMSKTPIRSALEHLESQGLVAVSPQQGIVVRDLSAHEITDLFDMRAAIEPFVVSRLAGRTLARDQVDLVQANLREQRSAAAAGDALAATRLDIAFHTLLADLLDNREISAWLARCFDKLHRSILRINRLASGRLLKSYEDHAAIAAAVLAGKETDAGQGMAEHLRYGRQFLLGGQEGFS
jgi:DNA-binding GntR family transcriptional regulator